MTLSLITATYDRPSILKSVALPSVLQQVDSDFQWIVVNDGADPSTRSLIESLHTDCELTYLEMEHPNPIQGFGLCHARNLGLSAATGDLVAYLDDDNRLEPSFIASTKQFFQKNPSVRCSMAQQHRRRDVIENGEVCRQGKPFISPTATAQSQDLICQRELFDSNGFTHFRQDSPQWNPVYRIFADYHFLLQCLAKWGCGSFQVHPAVLIHYIQRSDGIIGRSSYLDWALELKRLQNFVLFTQEDVAALEQLIESWMEKHYRGLSLAGFR